MTIVLSLLTQILHLGLMLAAAPTVTGALDWLDARLSGRSGAPILSPWRDLLRWSRKTPVVDESVSVVSRLAPALALGATASSAALVPSFTLGMALAPLGDVLVIVSLLAIARVASALAALDSGAARPGLAAQNASARSVLAEPALMLSVVTLALIGGSFNLDLIIGQQREGLLLPAAASTVAMTAMLALMFAEASVTDAGGSDAGVSNDGADQMASGTLLATVRMTFWLRRVVWINLIGALFLPVGMAGADSLPLSWLIGLAFWAVKLVAFILGLSAIQTVLGRVPRRSLPDLIGVAALLALLAVIMVLASSGTA
jgi:formate hydrogenlyase subunit 4